jgi:hypothetical protein
MAKKKKTYKPTGNISQGIQKNGRAFYYDEKGVRVSKKTFVKYVFSEGESPEVLKTAELQKLYKAEVKKADNPRTYKVRLANGTFAPKILQDYAKKIAKEQGTNVKTLIEKNPDLLQVLRSTSHDIILGAKAETEKLQGFKYAKLKVDTEGEVNFDKSKILNAISAHNGKIFIGDTEYNKEDAIGYFIEQVLIDVESITNDEDGKIPFFVEYKAEYNAAENVLFLPESYTDYVAGSDPIKQASKGRKTAKK